VGAVTKSIDGARLVHLAAHGDLRQDSPLFSSFRLADGPETVYDLEGLDRAPSVIVLSACESAVSEVDPGDEMLGLAASLLGLGTRSAIAAVVPIPDRATVALMDCFHQELAAGASPGTALAAMTAGVDGEDPGLVAASGAFVCLGAA
jgi:CHAT domain-containing protein